MVEFIYLFLFIECVPNGLGVDVILENVDVVVVVEVDPEI